MESSATTIDVFNKIDGIINETEDKVNSIFEPSPILTATYREQGYRKIKGYLKAMSSLYKEIDTKDK